MVTLTTVASILIGSERMQVHMGTFIAVSTEQAENSDEVFSLFSELDHKLSTYKNDSEISRLNRGEKFEVSEQTLEILTRSLQMHHRSEGAFDITVGAWSHQGYRFGYENEREISEDERERLGRLRGIERIHIDGGIVSLEEGTTLDLGGIAKGYAVDLSILRLLERGAGDSVVAASGDIGCIGPCLVQIQNPFVPEGSIGTIRSTLPRLAVSTSGNYERYIRTKENNHLLDPKTGRPQQVYASITLIDDQDNTRLDALATAVSVMDEDQAISMLEREGIAYLLIRNDQNCIHSKMKKGISLKLNLDSCRKGGGGKTDIAFPLASTNHFIFGTFRMSIAP